MAKIDEDQLKALISEEIASAESYAETELTPARELSINYYNGKITDVPVMPGRSAYVDRTTSNVIGWVLPSIIRVFTASERIVDCLPETEQDEPHADQAADYINFAFWRDNPGYQIMWDATHDALLQKDGIVKQFWDIHEDCKYSTYTGLTEDQIAILMSENDVEIVEQSEPYQEQVPVEVPVPQPPMQPQEAQGGAPEGQQPPQMPVQTQIVMQPVELYDIKTKRTTRTGKLKYETVAPDNFLTDVYALDLSRNWRFQAEKCANVTRSDLIKMGFARDRVDAIPAFQQEDTSAEDMARRSVFGRNHDMSDKSMEVVDLYECYIKTDINDDGMAEIVRVMYAGDSGGAEILDWEEWDDETPYDKIPCNPVPHRFYSDSLADEVNDVAKFKTVVGRQMFDNLYQTNMPQPVVETGSVENMDALVNPQVGVPILTKAGAVIQWNATPFIGDKALMMLQYLDSVVETRTGVSRSSMALDPETLQNQTATASQMQHDAAYSQVELIARNQAELGWKMVFQKSLRIIVKNQDRPRTIRLRDEWVDMDPRQWNTGMDVIINVGLGTGSRDRDIAILSSIQQSQIALVDRLAGAGFVEEALDMLPKLVKSAVRIAEAAGVKAPETYYPDVKPEAMAAMKQKAASQQGQGTPAQQAAQAKIQADQQMKQAELQMKQQVAQQDAQIEQQKMQQGAAIDQAEMQQEAALKREQMLMEQQLKREQLAAEFRLKREQMAEELQLKREYGFVDAFTKGSASLGSNVHIGGEPG